MMHQYRSSLLLTLAAGAALGLSACKPQLSPDAISYGGADFTRYVAVGNSLTAGFADGTLYRSGQQSSYPAILSYAFSRNGASDYKAPLLPGEYGWPTPKRILGLSADCLGAVSLGPIVNTAAPDTAGSGISVAAQGPYNNLGVPGIRAIDYLVPGYPALNPYARRFFTNLAGRPLEELSRIQPTFFTLWIGNNDVLQYATSGGSGKSSGGTPFDVNAISGTALFKTAIDSIMARLMPSGNAVKGVVISIPDVTAIPYFTTVPYNGLTLSRQGQVDSLNFAYQAAGVSFTLGANPFIIADASVPVLGFRKAAAGEYILLTVPQDSIKCAGWGSRKPIPAQYVLDAREVKAVQDATTIFNGILHAAAVQRGLAYVDMGAFLKTVTAGIQYSGVSFNTTFVKGGAFSLDGVHLTPRGYALVANEILRSINYVYGATLPMADVNSYNGLAFP